MSRSRKHVPIVGIGGETDKLAKRRWNREFRRRSRTRLHRVHEFDAMILPSGVVKELASVIAALRSESRPEFADLD